MFKVKNEIAQKIIIDMFKLSNPTYNLRSKRDFVSNHVKTLYFGPVLNFYLGPKLWDLLPKVLKTLTSLTQLKSQVKKWIPQNCTECWIYIIQVTSSLYNLVIFHSFIFFNQLICNYCFIYLSVYILYSWNELAM